MSFQYIKRAISEIEYSADGQRVDEHFAFCQLMDLISELCKKRHFLFFVGNGGSAGIATHMSTDFLKNGCIKTHSLLDPSTITCLGNDYGYQYIFSKQLEIVAEPGDMLVAISSSGCSPNILNAVAVAREKGCKVVTLSGFRSDNPLRQMGDINIYVPNEEYGIVESIHNMILQEIVDELMEDNAKEKAE